MQIRLATVKDTWSIGQITVDTWRSTYRGIVSDSFLDSMCVQTMQQRNEKRMADPTRRIFVAEQGDGRILGYAACGPNRDSPEEEKYLYSGELYALYVLKQYQGQGIGQMLVSSGASWLQTQGHKAMIVWALRENPFRRFYEKLGGVYLRESVFEIDDISLPEVAYGWREIDVLI